MHSALCANGLMVVNHVPIEVNSTQLDVILSIYCTFCQLTPFPRPQRSLVHYVPDSSLTEVYFFIIIRG